MVLHVLLHSYCHLILMICLGMQWGQVHVGRAKENEGSFSKEKRDSAKKW